MQVYEIYTYRLLYDHLAFEHTPEQSLPQYGGIHIEYF